MSPLQYRVPYHSHSVNDKKIFQSNSLLAVVTSATAGSSSSNLLLSLHLELASLTDLYTGGGALQLLGHGSIADSAVPLALALSEGFRSYQPFTGHTNHQQTADNLN